MNSNFQKDNEERNADLHLMISEKYMAYRELADRCFLSRAADQRGEKRVFYMKPKSPFLEDARTQNQFRNEFIRQVGQAPAPEPLTYLADDLHKAYIEKTADRSSPSIVKDDLCNFFKRRQYKLQHRKYKMLLRWAHHCLTAHKVDQTAVKMNPTLAKIQFELENCVKRYSRLEGTDHFLTPDRPSQAAGSSYIDGGHRPPLSALRADDIDVYLRIVTHEEAITRSAEKFIQRTKWAPVAHRFDIYQDSIEYFQEVRNNSLKEQTAYLELIQQKGQALIDLKKLGADGAKELNQIVHSKNITKLEKKVENNPRERYMNTAKYNYDLPPVIFWNEVELKIRLQQLALQYRVQGDMEMDNGHSFSYSVMVFFPQQFQHQVIQNQFAPYDAIPSLINPANLNAQNIKKVLKRNQKKYGRTQGANTLLEVLEIQKHSKEMGVEFLNSVETSLFGEFNNAQLPDFPSIRIKNSDWVEFICFKAEIQSDQMYQAGILSGDKNWIDECLANMLEVLNVQDVQNVNLIFESISQIHYDKIKYGTVKTDFLNFDSSEIDSFFTEDQKSFLSLFKSSLKAKADFDAKKSSEELHSNSLHEIPQHLLFANYLLQCLNAREQKTKLLYTLNTFRAIQRRITIELREMGSRDKVLGDAFLVRPMEQRAECTIQEDSSSGKDGSSTSPSTPDIEQIGQQAVEAIDIVKDALVDINKYRFNKKMQNFLYSTCPLVPKFHAAYGQPIERQEISQEIDNAKNSDYVKQQSKKFLGRIDKIYKHAKTDLNLVQDDFGIHIFYDASFIDMRNMETEILKICSFYINKNEPLLDNDLRNMYPVVDRLKILDEALHFENLFQEQKLQLVQAYLECYEHTSDILEQQRLIQAIVDQMALRPKLNLSGLSFKDSYQAEIDCLKSKTELVRQVMKLLMANEAKENNKVNEYLEKAYRLLAAQISGEWKYIPPEHQEDELNKREYEQIGVGGIRDAKNDMLLDTEASKKKLDDLEISRRQNHSAEMGLRLQSYNYANARDFAEKQGIPWADLETFMKEHHERDHLVRQSLHESASFIKACEGYPVFIKRNAQIQNEIQFNSYSEPIGLLDFYESLSVMSRVIAAVQNAVTELNECHRPDNGLLTTSLEKSTYKYLLAELKTVINQENLSLEKAKGMQHLDDNQIVGNSDKILFFSKELAATQDNQQAAHNPFVIGKFDIETIQAFDFQPFQGYIDSVGQFDQQDNSASRDKITRMNFGRFYPKLKQRANNLKFPSMLHLSCNAVELVRLRHTLLLTIEQTTVLEDVYNRQTKLMGKEGLIYFKDQFNFQNYVSNGGDNFVNFIEDGPGNEIDIKLAINEFDKSLRSCIDFSDPECFKAMITPMGLEELRAVVQYEVMNLQALIVGVRTNQILLDNSERKLREIDFFQAGFTVANPVFNLFDKLQGQNLFENNLKKLPITEKSLTGQYIKSSVGEGYYNIILRKAKMKEQIEQKFKLIKNASITLKDQKIEVTQKQLRAFKLVMCHDYCQDILARVYCDAVKLQILQETDNMRKRIYLLPRESIFLELFPPKTGEHQFAAYNEDHQEKNIQKDKTFFFNKNDNRIQNFWRLPLNHEILAIDMDIDHFKAVNLPKNFVYDMGSIADKTLAEFFCTDILEKVKSKVQKLTLVDSRDFEQILKEKQRLVEFGEAFDYSLCGRASLYLQYFKSLSNIFDLEFFTNKLASSAFTISNVEKMVVSGVPFWEEGDEALLEGMNEEVDQDEEEEEEQLKTQKQKNNSNKMNNLKGKKGNDKFDEGGHKPLKNVLASKVAEKIAQEKRTKMQLLQDLESIKDKFLEYDVIMKKQEMSSSLQRAATFLHDIHHITYYGLLFILYQMQDNYFKEQKGQKEIQFINEVIQSLSHKEDMKITYLNGFHVNYAITGLSKVNLECSCIEPDYDSFFKATQPVIDEEALNPPEFNLISGIYLTNSINLITFKKSISCMGAIIKRDYQCLDYALINLSKDVRKYLMSNLNSNDLTLQSFIKAKMKVEEKEYRSNPSVYSQILQEKKGFFKLNIKARQSRRIMMIVQSKKMIPFDTFEYNELLKSYNLAFNWKINRYIDQIISNRATQAKRETETIQRKNPAQGIVASSKHSKESPVLKSYDYAAAEIEVINNELNKYMIKTAFDMFENETNALAKIFELTDLKVQTFIHPVQQFASTFHQLVDNRNHLDIINKVGPIQKMLTQIKNRCLEIQTLTSGVGVVISSKDLTECLEECCRSLIKFGEIEMRTRCEHLSMTNIQFENLLYIKDRQLLNLENKLRTAKQEINKIVNTKVFSRGNNLIYELDMTNRQLRLIKDNIFLLEKNLTEKIRLCYDRELDQTRMQLADFRKQFKKEFVDSLNQGIIASVRQEVNTIDAVMKQKTDKYKDLTEKTKKEKQFDDYISKQVNIHNTTITIDNVIINKDGSVVPSGSTDPRLLEELETLKMMEKEAREEVLRLQGVIRKYRIMNKWKEVLTAERHRFKIDNLKQQLTSNTTLWEQLAEGEKREKILKQEIERAQQEIATQEKIIDRLKDDIKKEGREKQKLLQYKNTKSKRLDELETKAREFEVLSSVNLGKILQLLESKERKIQSMSQNESSVDEYLKAMTHINKQEIAEVKAKAKEENKYKMEAMTKLEGLRQELQMIQGNDQVSVGFWKEQCQSLFDICKNLKEDNEKLVENLGNLSENAILGMPQTLYSGKVDEVPHPLDQYTNNQDLLNYLNGTSQTNHLGEGNVGISQPGVIHRRGNSEQVSGGTSYDQDEYEKKMFGMNQSLRDHMMGVNRKGSQHQQHQKFVQVAGSSIHSLGAEARDMMPYALIGQVQLPKINVGAARNQQYLGTNRKQIIGQQSPFMIQDSIISQSGFTMKQGRQGNPLGGQNPSISGTNVFQSLSGGGEPANSLTAQKYQNSISKQLDGGQPSHSVEQTTMMQSFIQHSLPNQEQSHMIGNLFSFAAAPNTQRTAVNLDSAHDSLIGGFPEQHQTSKGSVHKYGEQSSNAGGLPQIQNTIVDANLKKRAQQAQQAEVSGMKLSLQPKLIQPPSKLTKTLDHQGARGGQIKRNPQLL